MAGHRSAPLVGRVAELDALTGALDDACAGTGRIAVVLGDAGIGKTRLVEELVMIAQGSGVVTARTRCPEDGAIPAFRPAVDLAEQVRRTGAVTAGIVPPTETGATSLFRLYEAVERGLRSTSAPLLVVVDDLQWADADTLRLLAHVAGGLRLAPVLLAVTVRTSEEHSPALLDCLAAFARAPGSVHVALDGLSRSDVATWLHHHRHDDHQRDGEIPSDVVDVVHERTGGHPLFLKELGELLRAEGGLTDADTARSIRSIPPAVQFVVRRRVARLPVDTQQLLGVAAVVGRNFELDVVADVAGRPLDEALDQIVPALASGIVVDVGERGFHFSHALVAEALAAEMNSARRARLHARTARAIADRAGPGFGHRAEVVAHHAFLGRFAGTSELAATAAAEAARRASAGFGYEEAATQWERSLIAQRAVQPVDRHAELHALHELAASRFRADLVAPAKEAAIEAMDLAEATRDHAAMLGAAALVGHPHLWPNQGYGEIDRPVVAALRRVLGALDPDDDRARALVLGALAVELTYADPSEVGPIQEEAEDAARRSGDPGVLARVLLNVAGPLRPTELERRRELAREVIDLGERGLATDEVTLVGWFHLAVAEWDATDFDAAIDHLRTTRRIADRIGGGTVRAQLGWYEAATAIARGRYDEARRICDEADHLYRRTRRFNADVIGLVPHVAMACDLGGGDEVFAQLASVADGSTFHRLSRNVAAWHLVETGDLDGARSMVAAGADLVSPFPDDFTFLCGTTLALHVAAALGDADTVASLAERLTPYAGRWTQAGSGPIAAGLVDLALARAAAALGDGTRARALFERAVAGHERLRTPAWLARSLRDQAAFLGGTGDADDRSVAASALAHARRIAVEHDLVPVVESIDRVAADR